MIYVYNGSIYVASSAFNGQSIILMLNIWPPRQSGAYKEVLLAGISLMDSIDTLSCSECHVGPAGNPGFRDGRGMGVIAVGGHMGTTFDCVYIWSSPIQEGIMYWV